MDLLPWLLFILFCPADDACSFHVATFPTEQACHAARRELGAGLDPLGRRSIRRMECARSRT